MVNSSGVAKALAQDCLERWRRRMPPICAPWSKGDRENSPILQLKFVADRLHLNANGGRLHVSKTQSSADFSDYTDFLSNRIQESVFRSSFDSKENSTMEKNRAI